MTDNANTTPEDDVLARAKAAFEAHHNNDAGEVYARYRTLAGMGNVMPEMIATLDTALARIREQDAEIARLREAGAPLAEFEARVYAHPKQPWNAATLLALDGENARVISDLAWHKEQGKKYLIRVHALPDDAVAEWRDSSGNARPVRADADARAGDARVGDMAGGGGG